MDREKDIPIWKKYNLTIIEASEYFNIGEKKLRSIISADPTANYILYNGNKVLIKRELFEKALNTMNLI